MAIYEEQKRQMGAGQAKVIDEGATEMVFDILQKSQYNYPVPSTIREIASNAMDSIKEKNMAKDILSGKAKVEDYFANLDFESMEPNVRARYKDSHFDASYYDPKYLSEDDTVYIRYMSGGSTERDKIIISDYGVGMREDRLKGYFKIGYSTKRLSKLPLGKWGIGAKSPLSVGVDFYTIESNYNGKKFRFNIYSHSYDSIIPRYNLEDNTENQFTMFGDYKVYWESTQEKNGVIITIGAKKVHKKDYIDAVKSQLLYFDNIDFAVTEENGNINQVNYKATILYEDEYIILSDNLYYTKPHLLLNKINYGYINWGELELQDRNGNIGIKVAPEDIEVTPSREGVIWSEKTKAMVNQRFLDVQTIAAKAIQEELKETDFWKWIRTCFSIGTRYSHNGIDIISRLAKIIDVTEINPVYVDNPKIKFTVTGILSGLNIRHVTMENEQRQNKYKNIVKRKEIKEVGSHINYPVFFMPRDTMVSNRKDKWLLKMYPHGFLLLREPMTADKMREVGEFSDSMIEWMLASRAKRTDVTLEELYNLMITSEGLVNYDSVEVPDNFKGTDTEEEEKEETTVEEEEETKVAVQSAAERRKLEGKIIVHTPRILGSCSTLMVSTGQKDAEGKTITTEKNVLFVSQKVEQKISEINNWDEAEIYYGTDADDEMIHFVAAITRDRHPGNDLEHEARRYYAEFCIGTSHYDYNTKSTVQDKKGWIDFKWWRVNQSKIADQIKNIGGSYSAFRMQHFYDNREIKLIKVSQANVKYVRDFRHIQEFFIQVKDKKITMSNLLVKWNTARLIQESIHKAAFLYNFSRFNEEYAVKYSKLIQYVNLHYREVKKQSGNEYYGLNTSTYNDLVSHLTSVYKFQEFVQQNPDEKEMISGLAMNLFGNSSLQNGMAVDPEVIAQLQDVLHYCQAVGDMLNYLPILTGLSVKEELFNPGIEKKIESIPERLEYEIKLYLEYKEVLDYGKEIIPPTENNNTGGEVESNITSQAEDTEEVTDQGNLLSIAVSPLGF